MPRDGSGNFSLPANTLAVSGDPISSTKFNSLVQDVEADLNVDRPITAGGTGSSTALGALTNLFSGASPGGADKIAFWDQSATSFGWLSLGTGLTFSGTTLALDADLATLAGLTPTANNFIVGNAGGTAWEVKTPADSRTALGLGTAAVVNTGTSGATIPLLNAANTFSTTQVFSLTNAGGAAQGARIANGSGTESSSADLSLDPGNNGFGTRDAILRATNNGSNQITFSILQANADAPATTLSITPAGVATMLGNTIWHAGNDGAGSGLDADTLDGVQGSAYATLAGTQTFSGTKTFSSNSGTAFAPATGGTGGGGAVGLGEYVTLTGLAPNIVFNDTSAGINNWFITMNQGTIIIGDVVTGTPTSRLDLTNTLAAFNVPVQARAAASATTTGTLTAASANKTIQATGDITINNSVFAAGDIILIYAGASSRTITEGASVTMRLGGSATTGSRTLAARGVAMLFFVSASEVVVSGSGVT